jgi:hypothetical protein
MVVRSGAEEEEVMYDLGRKKERATNKIQVRACPLSLPGVFIIPANYYKITL